MRKPLAASPWKELFGDLVISRREEGEDIQMRLEPCPGAKVLGSVKDPQGKPIPNAGVLLSRSYDDMSRSAGAARAGGDGSFVLRDLPWTGYRFTPIVEGQYGPSATVLILPGENQVTVPVPAPDAVLRGTIRDAEGRALPGLEISYSYSEADVLRYQFASTDKAGNFAIPDLFPGRYHVVVDNRGYSFWAKEVTTSDPPVEVALQPSRKVRFEIVSPEGNPVTAISVSGEAQSPRTQPCMMWSEEGTYSVEVPEGETKLFIEPYWGEHPRVERSLAWPQKGDIELGRIVAGQE